MEKAELLSSLAQKVNEDNKEQSMENAWKSTTSLRATQSEHISLDVFVKPACHQYGPPLVRFHEILPMVESYGFVSDSAPLIVHVFPK
ncbi:hypothetical protein YC2023_112067 [Brassica napus]